MATKIKRCLYIGLGGTGMKSLLHTKKMFIETYGEVPPMIGFLGIDTDGGEYKKELDSKYGSVSLTPNEQLPIKVDEARPIYEVNKEHFAWLPEQNIYALTSMTLGAGQIRTNGRFAITVNHTEVENKIVSVLTDITRANISNNEKYELLANEVEIHIVFSLCGGTGCGTFINMAYLLKKFAPTCKLTGYGVLPDVFEAMTSAGMAKVKPNAYGAIQDLDWLMHLNLNSDKIALDYINYIQETNDRPFNAFIFIDNKNPNNDTYTHIDQIAEMISLALITSAGELSTASASVSDNLEKNIREGAMDIENKKAWAAGLGVCEILFRGQDLGEIYAIKAAKRLIEQLLNSCVDADTIVNHWIDSKEVNIRENNGFDNVIDYMLSKTPRYPFSAIDDHANAQAEVDMFVNSAMPKEGEIDEKIQDLSKRVSNELHKLMVKEINQECGIGAAESIIVGIQAQVNVFLKEMNTELDEFKDRKPGLEAAVKMAVKDLSDYDSKFFKKSSKTEEYCEDVINAATQLAVNGREIIRRKAAITFYTGLQAELLDHYTKVKNIKNILHTIFSGYTNRLAEIQNQVGRASQTFQIDLAQSFVNKVALTENEVQVEEFLKSLTYPEKIYEFDLKRAAEIEKVLFEYTQTLSTSKSWARTTVDDVMNKMDEESFTHILRTAINKSAPLFRYNYRGYTPLEKPCDSYYIGVPDKKNSRLIEENRLKNMLPGNVNLDFASIGVKDRIIIYRQIGVVPAYCITPLPTYEEKYNNCNACCHFDAIIRNKMLREEYNLYPKAAVDDSLELWVKGFIFGLIKNENEKYYYQSEEFGDPLDDNWVELLKYRDEAFDAFKRNKTAIRKEFNQYFEQYQKTKGAEAMQTLIDDAKRNYYDKFSQIDMSKDQIKSKGFESIRKLITNELEYVKKEL